MKNWLTSLFGILVVAAGAVSKFTTGTVQQVAEIVTLTAAGLGLHASADKKN